MTLDELYAFIQERDAAYRQWKEGAITDKERILSRMAKLSEEVGELAEAVLASIGIQRKAKLDAFNPEQVSEEIADVIITTLLTARTLGVDVTAALEKKMAKINARGNADWTTK